MPWAEALSGWRETGEEEKLEEEEDPDEDQLAEPPTNLRF